MLSDLENHPAIIGFQRWWAHQLFTGAKRIRFYRKLSAMLRYGKRLSEVIQELRDRAMRKGKGSADSIFLSDVLDRLRSGKGLADAMEGYAPVSERMLLSAGERSGELPDALDLAVKNVVTAGQMRSAAISAISGPFISLLMLIGSLLVVSYKVVPDLSKSLDPERWTGAPYGLYVISEGVRSPWMLVGMGLFVLFLVAVIVSLPRWCGPMRSRFDGFPPYSFYRTVQGSVWLLALAALVRSGVMLSQALEQMALQSTPWMRERLELALTHLRSGKDLGRALEASNTGFPDPEAVEDMVSYATLPDFDRVLSRMGDEQIELGLKRIERQAAGVKGIVDMLFWAFLGFFTLATLGLQTQMSQSVLM